MSGKVIGKDKNVSFFGVTISFRKLSKLEYTFGGDSGLSKNGFRTSTLITVTN